MRRIIQLIKERTLPVSIAIDSLLYLVFAFIPALDGAANFFTPILDAALPLFTFLVLYVTFCKVDFHKLISVGWHLWIALSQVLMVVVVIGVILFFHVTGGSLILPEALLTCVIYPCASAATVVTQKLGGNLEGMTTYTFLSNFLCASLIPICFPLLNAEADITFWSAFVAILYKVCLVLVVPIILVYTAKHWYALCRLYQWVISVNNLSYCFWGCSLLIVSDTTTKNIVHAEVAVSFLLLIAVLALIFCLIQFAMGRYIGYFFRGTINAGQALGQKNTAFAIWIAYTYLSPLLTVGPGCYILWQNIINSVEVWRYDHAIERKSK